MSLVHAAQQRLAGWKATLGDNVPDLMMVAGAGLVSCGAWLLHPAAGCITAGVLLLTGGVIASRSAD
jgi:hypothetical protein